MPVTTKRKSPCRESHADYLRATFRGAIEFDSTKRDLELVLSQATPDDEADPFENLVLPLSVLLVEQIPVTNHPGAFLGYEDLYVFTHDGYFMSHMHRQFKRENSARHYSSSHFAQDGDISKLYRYGEIIKDMIGDAIMGHTLDTNPTVEKLKTHTLWKSD